jgi:hypothetical protein
MASFWVEIIRTTVMGSCALAGSYGFYRHAISSNTRHVKRVDDGTVAGIILPSADPSVKRVVHETRCLTDEKNYKLISESSSEIYFAKPSADADFNADCKTCHAHSTLYYDPYERDPATEFIIWSC